MAENPKQVLATILGDRPDLVAAAGAIFDHAQFLLDDDERLTKTGALDGVGRDQLRARALETLGGPTGAEPEPDEDADEADGDDDDEAGDDEDGEDDA